MSPKLFTNCTFLFLCLALHAADAPLPVDHAERMQKGLGLFTKEIAPLLTQHCLSCHGGEKTKGDLNIASREDLLKGGAEGPAVLLWKGKESRLFRLAAHLEEPHMPKKADKLSESALKSLVQWIDWGAPYDRPLIGDAKSTRAKGEVTDQDREFWSFQPLLPVVLPKVPKSAPVKNSIDRFILAKLQEQKLEPNPPASPRQLIRRIYLDVIGMPPSPEEVQRFEVDPSDQAYAQIVDRLLTNPGYGERWARHWLDAARFGESHGFEQDYDRPTAFWFRDFVIKALNEDMPFDQFIAWQLAGDELAPENPWAWAATGFLGAGVFPTQLTEAEFESARYDELDSMAGTVGTAMLGLTIGCARCHDHKFDPIPYKDYYRFAANFTTAIRSEMNLSFGDSPKSALQKVLVTTEGMKPLKHHADDRGFPHFYPQTYFLKRGDPKQREGEATAGFLQVVSRKPGMESNWQKAPPKDSKSSFRRTGLANWITDSEQGAGDLLARVIANRIWQHHFGKGLVATPNDFGAQGERPSHPELLDWLAGDLQQGGWKLKRIHREILLSATYRQSSQVREISPHAKSTQATSPDTQADRENKWFSRFPVQRLEAEAIRDSMLSVSGELEKRLYGPGTLDPNMPRRSIYFFIKRSQLVPVLMLFDAPEPNVSVGNRVSTTIAPQALHFMNSKQSRDLATAWARRLLSTPGNPMVEILDQSYRSAIGRKPSKIEKQRAIGFLENQLATYRGASTNPSNPELMAWTDFCQVLFGLNEFIYIE